MMYKQRYSCCTICNYKKFGKIYLMQLFKKNALVSSVLIEIIQDIF